MNRRVITDLPCGRVVVYSNGGAVYMPSRLDHRTPRELIRYTPDTPIAVFTGPTEHGSTFAQVTRISLSPDGVNYLVESTTDDGEVVELLTVVTLDRELAVRTATQFEHLSSDDIAVLKTKKISDCGIYPDNQEAR